MKLLIINHTFQKPQFYKRWKLLAEKYKDLDITLLAPSEWKWGWEKNLTYGTVDALSGTVVEEERFRIHLIDIQKGRFGGWTSQKMEQEILNTIPDVVYYIGEHTQDALMQLLDLKSKRKDLLSKTKFIAFSMRGHQQSLKFKFSKNPVRMAKNIGKYIYFSAKIKKLNKLCDAIFCHYPDALSEFCREGYKKPIYMQTQVGVDTDVFHPDVEARTRIREKYEIGDAYLFGSASRFNVDKGLGEIIKALPQEGNWKYLMMGWGRPDEVEKIKAEIASRGLQDKIILTGFIDTWDEMAAHWNALDCAVHAPLTSENWEETFSLALVQAMATGLPVIGSSSGSVPYQIGEDGIILPEGDVGAMHKQFVSMIENPAYGKAVGEKMKKRAEECFSILHLNDCFYHTVQDVLDDVYDPNKVDMTKYLVEE